MFIPQDSGARLHTLSAMNIFLPSKCAVREGEKKGDFTVEKPDKHDLSQVIKVNINSDEGC